MDRKFKFTATRIAKLMYDGGSDRPDIYWDTDIGGSKFGLRVSPSGAKTYFAQARYPDGKTAKTTIGRADVWTPEDARDKAREFLKSYAEGVNPKQAAKEKQTGLTLEKIFADYLALRQRGKGGGKRKGAMRASTAALYRQIFDTHFSDWASRAPETITKQEIVERHERISQKRKVKDGNKRLRPIGGPGVADGAMRVLNAVYEYAMEIHEERITRNPVKVLVKIGAKFDLPPRESYIKPEDLRQVYDLFEKIQDRTPTGRDYLLLLLFTGARADEAARLRVADVNTDEGTAVFRETKTGKQLMVPIPATVTAIVTDRVKRLGLSAEDFVFPGRKAGAYYQHGRKAFAMVQEMGGPKVTAHYFRRGYKTYLKNIGVDELTRKRLMNHALPSRYDMNEWYTQHEMGELRKAVTRLERYILQQAGRWQGKVIQMRSTG